MIVMDAFQNFLAVMLYSLLFINGKAYGKLNLVCLIDFYIGLDCLINDILN